MGALKVTIKPEPFVALLSRLALLCLFSFCINAEAIETPEFSGLLSVTGAGAYRENNPENNRENNPENTLSSINQQDLRLMLDGQANNFSYEIHALANAIELNNITNAAFHTKKLFQVDDLKYTFIKQENNNSYYNAYTKLDRLNIKGNFKSIDFRLGRQAISWGVGRLWQPTDIFGAFDANDIVRDYKKGIDVLDLNYYPNSFSNLNLVYAFPTGNGLNAGIRYLTPVGNKSYLSILTANIYNNVIVGGSLETDWRGAGIRLESIAFYSKENNRYRFYGIVGFDYQFSNEWLLIAEIYYNSLGANNTNEFSDVLSTKYFQAGLLKQLSQQLAAVILQKNVTPLLSVNYLLISSLLTQNGISSSSLSQLSAIYSISDESDIWLTVLMTNGAKMNNMGVPQSEFGDTPLTASVLFRLYF